MIFHKREVLVDIGHISVRDEEIFGKALCEKDIFPNITFRLDKDKENRSKTIDDLDQNQRCTWYDNVHHLAIGTSVYYVFNTINLVDPSTMSNSWYRRNGELPISVRIIHFPFLPKIDALIQLSGTGFPTVNTVEDAEELLKRMNNRVTFSEKEFSKKDGHWKLLPKHRESRKRKAYMSSEVREETKEYYITTQGRALKKREYEKVFNEKSAAFGSALPSSSGSVDHGTYSTEKGKIIKKLLHWYIATSKQLENNFKPQPKGELQISL